MHNTPNDLKYTKTHEWLRENENENENEMTIGITEHAQKLLGDLVYVELPAIGHQINAGDEVGVVESVKAASDFYAPISGIIVGINEKVSEEPALINQSPYEDGWLFKIKATDSTEFEKLLSADEYNSELAKEQ